MSKIIEMSEDEYLKILDSIPPHRIKIGQLRLPNHVKEKWIKNKTKDTYCLAISECDLSDKDFPKITFSVQRISISDL